MKILEVSLGVAASSGGPVRSITGLTRALSLVPDCEVAYFIHNPDGVDRFDLANAKVFKGHWDETTGRDCSGDFERVVDSFKPDIVHFHGVWHLILHDDQRFCRKKGVPYLIAPRGSLDAWSMRQKRLKKWLAMRLFQMRDLRRALALHVTAEMEKEHCMRLGCKGPFIISANGVNLPQELPPRERIGTEHRALFMSRMHPKKGVLELVRAWGKVRPSGWVCELVYTLHGDEERKYERAVKEAVASGGLSECFIFTGALDDRQKWFAYRRADLFVLPTHTENFGIVIAEALYAGLPVLTTKNAPWEGLVANRCGWWIEPTSHQLERALAEATSSDDEKLALMGKRGRDYVQAAYSWPSIAAMFVSDCYKLIKRGSE